MTTTQPDEIDAQLVAFVDGVLPSAEAAEMRARLAKDPDLAARLAALDVDLSHLSKGWDTVLAQAPAAPVVGSGSLTRLAIAASVALALVLGGVLLGAARNGDGDGAGFNDWRDFAAAYHLLYRTETLANATSDGDGGVGLVSEVLGRDLTTLTQVSDLEFHRAQVLGWNDRPLVQFAYLDPVGRPVAICLMLFDVAPSGNNLSEVTRHGLNTASFNADGMQVLVIGAEGMEGIGDIAQDLATRL